MKKILALFAALTLTVGVVVAVAQTITVPQVTVINADDLIQIVLHGQPRSNNVYAKASQITAQSGYYKSSWVAYTAGIAKSNYSHTFANNETYAIFNNTGGAYLYITMAATPSDGARECIFSQAGIIANSAASGVDGGGVLYMSANTGQTLNNGLSLMAAATNYCWVYGASNATWDRN